jgi:ABC-type cobalamin/Fe3+-siderophores transport system ATPase subunit
MYNGSMIIRKLSSSVLKNKSVLLIGPRQVGKSTLIKSFKPKLTLNLAEEDVFIDATSDPSFLKKQIETFFYTNLT